MREETFVPVSIRINRESLAHIRRVARKISFERDSDISYVDLIRGAIEREFPMPPGEDNEVHVGGVE